MPELPEVEVVRSGLAPAVVGARVTGVDVFDERALTRHVVRCVPAASLGTDFAGRLTGCVVQAAVRRGKFLWFPLEGSGEALAAHLGMSGQMILREPGAPAERHERIRLTIEHQGHGELAIVFADQRTFGSLSLDPLIATRDGAAGGYGDPLPVVASQAAHIARDPLDPAFDDRAFRGILARKRSAIKRVLLDQTVVSGIGNIYADESLWAAGIHPETRASALSARAVNRLLAEARAVLGKALAEGGTSFDAQYVNVNGEAGMPASDKNVPGLSMPLRARPSPYFGGECLRPLSPFVPSLPAKTFVEARPATGHGHVDRCSFRSPRPTACQSGQRRQAARGIEQDRAARMSAPDVVEHRHRSGLRKLRGGVHA